VRVAALYDVHGNLPALEAVLAELDGERVDAYVFGGDIVAGPMPRETLERVVSLGERAHVIRGNADRIALELRRGEPVEGGGLTDTGVGQQLTDEQAAMLERAPLTVTLDVDGLGPTCFCHATPRDDEEIFTERDPEDVVAEMLAGTAEGVVVCGHTHMQVDRRVGSWRVVNAGSVGLPNDAVGAHYALLGPDVELRQTDYDREAAQRAFLETPWFRAGESERKRFLLNGLLESHSRDEVLDFFEQMAARQRGA
jgi:predicted phosphodiesterase